MVDVGGTADSPDTAFYRREAIARSPDYSAPQNAAWIPRTTDMTQPAASGVLGQVDPTSLPDGLCNLRVTAFTGAVAAPGDESIGATGPIRVNNLHSGGHGATPTPGPTATPAPSNAPPSLAPGQGIPGVCASTSAAAARSCRAPPTMAPGGATWQRAATSPVGSPIP